MEIIRIKHFALRSTHQQFVIEKNSSKSIDLPGSSIWLQTTRLLWYKWPVLGTKGSFTPRQSRNLCESDVSLALLWRLAHNKWKLGSGMVTGFFMVPHQIRRPSFASWLRILFRLRSMWNDLEAIYKRNSLLCINILRNREILCCPIWKIAHWISLTHLGVTSPLLLVWIGVNAP